MTSNLKKHYLFFAVVAAIVVVLGGMIYYQESIIQDGQTVILATRPVDPRDLFRGEYVILRYEIETSERISNVVRGLPNGSPVYVELREGPKGIAYVANVRRTPSGPLEGLWITGEARYGRVRFPSLEQFYVPEGAGRPIENLREELHVEVMIKNGESRVVRLLDGSLNPIDPRLYLDGNRVIE